MAATPPRDQHEQLAASVSALLDDLRKGRSVVVFRQVFDDAATADELRFGRPPRIVVSIEPKGGG